MEEERKRIEEEEIGPAPEYASGIGNPNTPLVFPDFDPMPELRNIVKHNLGEEDDVPAVVRQQLVDPLHYIAERPAEDV